MILHEEAEDGNAMPDLARPVQTVKVAVDNLVKVGYSQSKTHPPGQGRLLTQSKTHPPGQDRLLTHSKTHPSGQGRLLR